MYDNVCKFLAESFSEDFSGCLIGTPIHLTELKPSELSLEPIRADQENGCKPRPLGRL
jgi:predicted transposase YdaD